MRSFPIIIATLITLLASPALSAPRLVVTIKPIHALATQVMAGVGTPVLLLKSAASPHAFTLKPSQATALNRADLIIMVDPNLERFLLKTIASLSAGTRVLTLSEIEGITRIRTRTHAQWHKQTDDDHEENHGKHNKEATSPGDTHNHGTFDPHLWLDPDNAKKIVTALADVLSVIDPKHATQYAANARTTRLGLIRLEHRLRKQLNPVKSAPYFVFHDAYHYFEHHFGLNAKGALTLSPDIKPGARRIYDIRKKIKRDHIKCVFAEPQFSKGAISAVLENTPARLGVLDPIGVSIQQGAQAYNDMMIGLARAITDCLSK